MNHIAAPPPEKLHVEICIACGSISTPKGTMLSNTDCQRTRKIPCTWQGHELTRAEVNDYCRQRRWKPIYV